MVRLLVTRFGGELQVGPGLDGAGSTVTVVLPRRVSGQELGRTRGVTFPSLNRAMVAGLLAGLAMGLFFAATSDLLPVIGALYAVQNPLVGWMTHLFHSVVFAILFAAGLSRPVAVDRLDRLARTVAAGIGWGTGLWLVAAGILMPLWLRVVGFPTALPNLPDLGLRSHARWGTVLGPSYHFLGRLDG